jgi:hypothetical protein
MMKFAGPAMLALVTLTVSTALAAQQAPRAADRAAAAMTLDEQIALAVEQSMHGDMDSNPHLALTPRRAANAGDSARAAKLVVELRKALAPYKDVTTATAAGYRMFAPGVANQPVYHYTHPVRALVELARFDPAQPGTLIYRRAANGRMELLGAMYGASQDLALEELDSRVPLSVARWHRHVNYCFPRERNRIGEMKDGKPLFGPVGSIATKQACEAAGGVFTPQLFGWMVHANVFLGDDPNVIWGDDHAHGGGAHKHGGG